MSQSRRGRSAVLLILILVTIASLTAAVLCLLHAADSARLLEEANARQSRQLQVMEDAHVQAANAVSRMDAATAEADSARALLTPLQEENAALTGENALLAIQLTDAQTALTAEKESTAALTADKTALTARTEDLTTRLGASETALASAQQSVSALSGENAALSATIAEMTLTLANTRAELTAAQESIAALTGENTDLSTRLNTAGASLQEAQALLEALAALMTPAE